MNAFTTCLWFDNRGEEAAKFYTERVPQLQPRLGDPVRGRRARRSGDDGGLRHQRAAVHRLNGGPEFTFDEAISFQIPCADQDEVDRYWDTLTEGGEESQCGWLKDKFGVSWQVVPTRFTELFNSADPEVAGRVGQALFSMKKIIIADLEAAAAG